MGASRGRTTAAKERRVRVLVVTPWYPHAHDGVGSFVEDQVRSVASHHNVAVLHLTTTGGHRVTRRADGDGSWPVVTAAAPNSGLPGSALLWNSAGVAKGVGHLRRGGFRPELVHAHVFSAALAVTPAARLLGAPLVVSEHYSGLARSDFSRHDRLAASLAYRAAAVVCPVSASLQDTLAGLAPNARFQVVPNPVDDRVFAPPKPASREGPVRVLVVASLVPVKGVGGFIEAVGRLALRRRDLYVTVIGDGPERSSYERKVRAAGVGDVLRLAGRQSRQEVARAMRESDLLVAPSKWETFSVAVAEALCCGLPVLATRVGALPELVDESSGRLVEPGDPAAMAAALDGMLDAVGQFDRAAISTNAIERWGAARIGARWDELYRQLTARTGRQRAFGS